MKSHSLLVDGVPDEGPGTGTGMLLGSVVGVFVSLPKTNSALSAVISSEFLLLSINTQDNIENMKHSPYLSSTVSQIFSLHIFTYFYLSYSVINFAILLLLSNFKFSFEGSEAQN